MTRPMEYRPTDADWLAYRDALDGQRPDLPRCVFCGARHMQLRTHPYCTTANDLRHWCASGRPPILANVTRGADRRDAQRDDERAHAIYRTPHGLDYCREDAPAHVRTYDAACVWADSHYRATADALARSAVRAYAIEWW